MRSPRSSPRRPLQARKPLPILKRSPLRREVCLGRSADSFILLREEGLILNRERPGQSHRQRRSDRAVPLALSGEGLIDRLSHPAEKCLSLTLPDSLIDLARPPSQALSFFGSA